MSHCTQTLKAMRGSILMPTSAVIAGSTFGIERPNMASTRTIVKFTIQSHGQDISVCRSTRVNYKNLNLQLNSWNWRITQDTQTLTPPKSFTPVISSTMFVSFNLSCTDMKEHAIPMYLRHSQKIETFKKLK